MSQEVLLDELFDKVKEINELTEKLYLLGINVGFKQKPIYKGDLVINSVEYVYYNMKDAKNV